MKSEFKYLYILHILNDGYLASFSLLLPFIAQELSLNLTQAGLLGSLTSALGIFFALPAGVIAAKYGGLKTLVLSLLLYSLGYLGTGFATNYYMLILTFALGGIGFSLFHPIAFALVAKWSDKATRGRQMGNFTAIGDIGRIAISSGITFLITLIGWRYTSNMYAVTAILIFCYLYFFHLPKRDELEVKNKPAGVAKLSELIKNKNFVLASITAALDSFASASLFIFLPFLLLQKGIPPAILGSFTAAFFVGNLGGKAILGRFVDKIGNMKVFITAEILMAIFIFLLSMSNSFVLIILISIFLGALTKGTVPVANTILSDAIEGFASPEKAFGLNSLIVNIAVAMSPICLGFVSDTYGITMAFWISALFAVCAIIPALILHTTVNKTRRYT